MSEKAFACFVEKIKRMKFHKNPKKENETSVLPATNPFSFDEYNTNAKKKITLITFHSFMSYFKDGSEMSTVCECY